MYRREIESFSDLADRLPVKVVARPDTHDAYDLTNRCHWISEGTEGTIEEIEDFDDGGKYRVMGVRVTVHWGADICEYTESAWERVGNYVPEGGGCGKLEDLFYELTENPPQLEDVFKDPRQAEIDFKDYSKA